MRADTAGATHELIDYCREAGSGFSVGYELTEPVRAAILADRPRTRGWRRSTRTASSAPTARSAEITDGVELAPGPTGSRVIVRRERPHPGAQLSFTDHDGYRFQAILTDQPDTDIAALECRHRARAARRGPHPQRQGHRPAQTPVPRLRAQPGVAGDRAARARPDRLDPGAAARPANSPRPSPSGCATGCCTSPPGSRSTPARAKLRLQAPGPGPANSPPPSPASKRCPPPPADPARQTTATDHRTARRPRHAIPLPADQSAMPLKDP